MWYDTEMPSPKTVLLLGQNIGTATHRLKKAIIFDMAGKLNLLSCYRCKQPIASVEELTVDHKEAWIGAADPVVAFFDLKNIAFSHPQCNYDARIPYRKYDTPEAAKLAKRAWTNRPERREKTNERRRWRRAKQRALGLKVE